MYCRDNAACEICDKANIQAHLPGLLLDSQEDVWRGFECVSEKTLVCTHYCGSIAAGPSAALLELGQVPACWRMSSEMKLRVHLIQGSRLVGVISVHVKKIHRQETSMKLWHQSINVHAVPSSWGEGGAIKKKKVKNAENCKFDRQKNA